MSKSETIVLLLQTASETDVLFHIFRQLKS